METTRGSAGDLAPLDPEALRVDARLEALLDESVAFDSPRIALSTERPFAPWEVRNARHWRFPVLAAGGLVGASLATGLLPLWRLGPGTAVVVWVDLVAAALVRPVEVLTASVPLVVRAVSALRGDQGIAEPVPLLLLGTVAVGTLTWVTWLRSRNRPAREGARAPRS